MTNEDAVNLMGQLRVYISGGGVIDRKLDEAVMMAIEALKEFGNQSQEVNNPNDCISRQVAIDALSKHEKSNGHNYTLFVDIVSECAEIILDLPSVQPDIIHCKDCKYWQDQEEGIVEVPICARPQNKYEKYPLVMLIDGDGFCSFARRRE